jgi:hypothetical protein
MNVVSEIPAGAMRVHMVHVNDVWKPRGSLKKNSLSADLLERLESLQVSWTDECYGDGFVDDLEAADKLIAGLRSEVEVAIEEFKRRVCPD